MPDSQENRETNDRETLRQALGTMSLDQLRKVRSTIIRLKHLPFTKLTEALFTEPSTTDEQMGLAQVREEDSASDYDSHGSRASTAARALLEDVDDVLRARKDAER